MNSTATLLEVLRSLLKWKRPILYTTAGVTILTVFVSLMMSNYYQAIAIFYPSNPLIASRGALFGTADEGIDPFGDQNEMNRLMLVAESTELLFYVINKFNLYEHYDIDSTDVKAPDKVRKAFLKLYNLKKNDNDALEISIEDKEPELAAEMLWGVLGKIDEINNRLVRANQVKILESYKKSIEDKQKEFKASSDSLNVLRKEFGIIDVEAQGEYLAEESTKTTALLASNKAKLKLLEKSSGVRRDSLLKVRALVKSLEGKLDALSSKDGNISLARFNEGREKITLVEGRQKSMSTELQFLKERYFQYEAVYNTSLSSIYIVEAPSVPVIKSRPRRSILVLSALLVAFIFSALGALLFENYKAVDWKKELELN